MNSSQHANKANDQQKISRKDEGAVASKRIYADNPESHSSK